MPQPERLTMQKLLDKYHEEHGCMECPEYGETCFPINPIYHKCHKPKPETENQD